MTNTDNKVSNGEVLGGASPFGTVVLAEDFEANQRKRPKRDHSGRDTSGLICNEHKNILE